VFLFLGLFFVGWSGKGRECFGKGKLWAVLFVFRGIPLIPLAGSSCRASKIPLFQRKNSLADWERFEGEPVARFPFLSKAEFAEGWKLVFEEEQCGAVRRSWLSFSRGLLLFAFSFLYR